MKKWRKYILCILIVTIYGSILSFIRNDNVLICDIYVMMSILLFEKLRIKNVININSKTGKIWR